MTGTHDPGQHPLRHGRQQIAQEQDPAAREPVRQDTSHQKEGDRGKGVRGQYDTERPGSAALPDDGVRERQRRHRGPGRRDQIGQHEAPEGGNS